MSKLAAFLGRAIPTHQQKQSSHLGDRTGYVGASDIAGCPRKAALGKQNPTGHDIKTLLRFSRGHAAQAMYAEFFRTGGALFEEEVEVRHPDIPEIRCHIDFLFYANRQTKRLHIVEMKSTDGIPDEPYSSWVDQLHVQMGLLHLTLDPAVEIGGSILVVDLNAGEYKEFNSYSPNKLVFKQLVEKGQHILAAARGECTPRTEPGILCGFCPYRPDCPSHAVGVDLPPEIHQAGKAYLELNDQKKVIDARLEVLKNDILTFVDGTFKGASDGILVNVISVADSVIVDSRKLKSSYPDIYDQVTKPKSGFLKLEIKPFMPLAAQAA
ncbi:MAG: hypothetical protein PHH29_16240 [Desulfuromonadaceae bacterium]|jgi:hypothetical protein|nr:hypothetical protein [Desulfuromonadaceae bacterium]